MLKNTKNNLLIDENIISCLKKYNINVDEFTSIREIQLQIQNLVNDENLSDEELDELDYIDELLQERNYYYNTNK